MRRKEQETRLRAVQQIFNPKLLHNHRATHDLAAASRAELAAFKYHLINEIEISYFTYLKTLQIVENYEQSLKLQEENLRVTRSLFQTEKITRDALYRAETHNHHLEQKRVAAINTSNLARNYFNFLLNRPLESEVIVDSIVPPLQAPQIDMEAIKTRALEYREEIKSLKAAQNAARHSVKIAEGGFLPSFALVADYGFQGESYSFTGRDDYWVISGVFQWNLFNGFTDKARLSWSRMELKKLENALAGVQRQIELEVEKSHDNVNSASRMLKVSRLASRSAGENFRMVARKYEQGLASQIEYLDAQTALISSRIEESITLYDYLIKLSELKLAVSDYELENL